MRRLLEKVRPSVVLLQETLVDSGKARNFMNLLRPEWLICAVSSVGKSGGLLVTWDPTIFELSPVLSLGGIFLTGMCLETKRKVALLNTYGPCKDRKLFWEKLDRAGLLVVEDLILAGDLNFTTSTEEIWGENARADLAVGFFKQLFSKNHLVDVTPDVVVPTWRNGRSGLGRDI
jgi:hypothetical protein